MGNNFCNTQTSTSTVLETPTGPAAGSPSKKLGMLSMLDEDKMNYEERTEPTREETRDILPDEIRNIHLADRLKVSKHEHELVKREQTGMSGWACDGRKIFKMCQGGITDFYQTAGVECWNCP
jgi:hypothetical protein